MAGSWLSLSHRSSSWGSVGEGEGEVTRGCLKKGDCSYYSQIRNRGTTTGRGVRTDGERSMVANVKHKQVYGTAVRFYTQTQSLCLMAPMHPSLDQQTGDEAALAVLHAAANGTVSAVPTGRRQLIVVILNHSALHTNGYAPSTPPRSWFIEIGIN